MGSCQSRRNGAVAKAHGNLAAGKRRQLLRRHAHLGGCQVHAEAVVGPSTPADSDGEHSHAFMQCSVQSHATTHGGVAAGDIRTEDVGLKQSSRWCRDQPLYRIATVSELAA